MLWYCLNYQKNTKSKNPKIARTKNGRIILLSKFKVCDSEKSNFITQQETIALLSSLRIKSPFSKITLVGPLLF